MSPPRKKRKSNNPVEDSIKTWINIITREADCYQGYGSANDHVLFKFKSSASLAIIVEAIKRRTKKYQSLLGIFNFGKNILIVFREELHPDFKKYLDTLKPFSYGTVGSFMESIKTKQALNGIKKMRRNASKEKLKYLDLFEKYYGEQRKSEASVTNEIATISTNDSAFFNSQDLNVPSPEKSLKDISEELSADFGFFLS